MQKKIKRGLLEEKVCLDLEGGKGEPGMATMKVFPRINRKEGSGKEIRYNLTD